MERCICKMNDGMCNIAWKQKQGNVPNDMRQNITVPLKPLQTEKGLRMTVTDIGQ